MVPTFFAPHPADVVAIALMPPITHFINSGIQIQKILETITHYSPTQKVDTQVFDGEGNKLRCKLELEKENEKIKKIIEVLLYIQRTCKHHTNYIIPVMVVGIVHAVSSIFREDLFREWHNPEGCPKIALLAVVAARKFHRLPANANGFNENEDTEIYSVIRRTFLGNAEMIDKANEVIRVCKIHAMMRHESVSHSNPI